MNLVNKVVEQILNEGLDTLASMDQHYSNTKKVVIIWMDPLKRTSANDGKSSIPQAADNSNHRKMSAQSSSTSLLNVIFLLAKQLNSERENWK